MPPATKLPPKKERTTSASPSRGGDGKNNNNSKSRGASPRPKEGDRLWEREKQNLLKMSSEQLMRNALKMHFEILDLRQGASLLSDQTNHLADQLSHMDTQSMYGGPAAFMMSPESLGRLRSSVAPGEGGDAATQLDMSPQSEYYSREALQQQSNSQQVANKVKKALSGNVEDAIKQLSSLQRAIEGGLSVIGPVSPRRMPMLEQDPSLNLPEDAPAERRLDGTVVQLSQAVHHLLAQAFVLAESVTEAQAASQSSPTRAAEYLALRAAVSAGEKEIEVENSRSSRLQKQLDAMDETVKHLRAARGDLEETCNVSIHQLQAQQERLQQQNSDLQLKLRNAELERDRAREEMERWKKDFEDIQEQNEELEKDKAKLSSENNMNRLLAEQSKADIEDLLNSMNNSSDQSAAAVHQLRRQLQAANEENARLASQIAAVQAEGPLVTEDMLIRQMELQDAEVVEMEDRLDINVDYFQRLIEMRLRFQKNQMQRAINDAITKAAALQNQLNELETQREEDSDKSAVSSKQLQNKLMAAVASSTLGEREEVQRQEILLNEDGEMIVTLRDLTFSALRDLDASYVTIANQNDKMEEMQARIEQLEYDKHDTKELKGMLDTAQKAFSTADSEAGKLLEYLGQAREEIARLNDENKRVVEDSNEKLQEMEDRMNEAVEEESKTKARNEELETCMEDLEKKLNEMIETLETRLKDVFAEKESLEKQLAEAKEQDQERSEKFQNLLSEANRMNLKLLEDVETFNRMLLQDVVDGSSVLCADQSAIEKELADKTQMIGELEKMQSELQSRGAASDEEFKKISDELAETQQQKKELEETVESLNKELEAAKHQQEDLKNENETLRTENENLGNEIKTLKEEVEIVKNELQDVKNENESLVKEKLELKNDFDAVAASIKEENENLKKEIEEVKTENENLKKENEQLKTDNETLNKQNEDLKSENENIKSENESLKSENDNLKNENEAQKAEQERLQQQMEETSSELNSRAAASQDDFKKLQEESAQLQQTVEDLKKQIEDLNQQVQERDEQLAELNKQLEEKEKELNEQKDLLSKTGDESVQQITSLQAERDEAESRNKILQNEKDEVEAKNKELEQQVEETEARNKALQSEKEEAENKIKNLEQEIDQIKKERDDLQEQLEKLRQQLEQERNEAAEREKQLIEEQAALQKQISAEKQRVSDLEDSAQASDSETRQKLSEVQCKNVELQTDLDHITSERDKLSNENSDLKKQLEEEKAKNTELVAQNEKLTAQLAKVTNSRDRLKAALKDAVAMQDELSKIGEIQDANQKLAFDNARLAEQLEQLRAASADAEKQVMLSKTEYAKLEQAISNAISAADDLNNTMDHTSTSIKNSSSSSSEQQKSEDIAKNPASNSNTNNAPHHESLNRITSTMSSAISSIKRHNRDGEMTCTSIQGLMKLLDTLHHQLSLPQPLLMAPTPASTARGVDSVNALFPPLMGRIRELIYKAAQADGQQAPIAGMNSEERLFLEEELGRLQLIADESINFNEFLEDIVGDIEERAIAEGSKVRRAMELLEEAQFAMRGRVGSEKLLGALDMLKQTPGARRGAGIAALQGRAKRGGTVILNINELDPKYRSIAWLVSTRGSLIDHLGDLFKMIYAQPFYLDKTQRAFGTILGTFLTQIEKMHIGLPPYLLSMEVVKVREATDKELSRILLHSSAAVSQPSAADSPDCSPVRVLHDGVDRSQINASSIHHSPGRDVSTATDHDDVRDESFYSNNTNASIQRQHTTPPARSVVSSWKSPPPPPAWGTFY